MEFDLENPLTSSEDEQHGWGSISALFAAEADHMISTVGLIDLSSRRDAVSLVLQAQFDCNLDPFVAYLAINYIDRFLSKRKIPREKPWIIQLLSIACLSLASKMRKTNLMLADFQGKEGFIFDAQTIQRMELLVLGTLDWRMRSVTPFSFLRFFISFFSPAQPPLLQALKAHATQILLKAQNEIKMLEFKPSVVAASSLLSAAYEIFPIQFPAFRAAVSSCNFVDEDKLWECSIVIGAATVTATDGCDDSSGMGVASSPETPVTVLGRQSSSSESETAVGSSSDGRELKKRRTTSTLHASCDHSG
ncbi:hypothetical protein OPV22_032014 [Ensete ventricosum]|uniref:Cyclin-like domain-containing protein n=1 Tax=Ensete ventricosum TaxID=4639 RepID=A0AAV8PQG4_ENSVE|nr:hypothetical protein OPV22_032014 [Ensete ventricosum]RWW56457.1 hypothetical protein BHE74_00036829 [Ensete ventricosum]RZS05499.1 hypothetical protein BHM03_00036034 [Ensete ventricosum]